ncbi:MAG: GGDEF domain-containing protein [Acidimicrobiales bacterium]
MKVLVVDDDATSVLLATTLVRRLGHDCDSAASAEEAWAKLETEAYDILVTDLVMPGDDGLELCRKVRSHEGRSYTYVILVTADVNSTRVIDAMRAGADDYITKPLSRIEVEARFIAAERVLAMQRQLETTARVDDLTGLRNRLALSEAMAAMDAKSTRYGHGFAVALIDLDQFKAYNDNYGHLAGDGVLQRVGEMLRRSARADDEVYRFGGEELLWLLPEQSIEGAAVAVERFRAEVEAMRIPHEQNPPGGVVTLSAGLAVRDATHARATEVVKAADEALYCAKQAGRNRVVRS